MFLSDAVEFSRRMDREGYGKTFFDDADKIVKLDDRDKRLIALDHRDYRKPPTIFYGPRYYANRIRDLKGRELTKPLEDDFNSGKVKGSEKLNKKRSELINRQKNKPIPKVNTNTKQHVKSPTPTPVKSTPKSSRKLVNKYTLGAAGLLGVGAAGYGGYKFLTRNKNKKDR